MDTGKKILPCPFREREEGEDTLSGITLTT